MKAGNMDSRVAYRQIFLATPLPGNAGVVGMLYRPQARLTHMAQGGGTPTHSVLQAATTVKI